MTYQIASLTDLHNLLQEFGEVSFRYQRDAIRNRTFIEIRIGNMNRSCSVCDDEQRRDPTIMVEALKASLISILRNLERYPRLAQPTVSRASNPFESMAAPMSSSAAALNGMREEFARQQSRMVARQTEANIRHWREVDAARQIGINIPMSQPPVPRSPRPPT